MAANFSTLLNLTGLVSCPASNMDCLEEVDLLAQPQVSEPLPDIAKEAGHSPATCVRDK